MHCTITDYGARPGDDALDTDALAEAVRDCHQSGGGVGVERVVAGSRAVIGNGAVHRRGCGRCARGEQQDDKRKTQ